MSQLVPSSSVSYWNESIEDDYRTMYADWDPKFGGHDFPFDSLNCRVPTKTTPTITPVTPTTLRNFEESILDYQTEAESHQNEAGFVPPLVQTMTSSLNSSANVSASTSIPDNVGCGGNLYVSVKSWQGGGTTDVPALISLNTNTLSPPIPTHVISMGSASSSSSSSSSSGRSRRSTGGRRPNKENGISPEEEQKKMVRRERNKIAAAKCRKKRVELIQNLEQTVRELEAVRDNLGQRNQELESEMDELRTIWETHLPSCRARDTDSPEDVKPFPLHPEAQQQHLLHSHHPNNVNNHHHHQQQHQHQQQHRQHQHQQHLVAVSLHDEKAATLSTVVVPPSNAPTRIYTSMGCGESLIIPDRIVMDSSSSTSSPSTTAAVVTTSNSGSNNSILSSSNHHNNNAVCKLRPNTLPLSTTSCAGAAITTISSSFAVRNKSSIAEITGIPITTPSAEFIDSLIEAGSTGLTPMSTGLTPVCAIVPSCSTQLRSANNVIVDLSSPDSIPTKLVSL